MTQSATSRVRGARAVNWRFGLTIVCAALLASCANGDLLPPKSLETPAAAPRATILGSSASRDRAKLIQAYGGDYSAPTSERFLNDILARLAPASESPGEPYHVTLLNSPVVNAFALPSGDIFVTRGLLGLANDASEVAAVMAHEIAHVTAHHASQRAELEKTAALFSRVSSDVLPPSQDAPLNDAKLKLSIAHFSRQQEFEADQIGIKVIAKAGYDPFAAARFLSSLGRWSAQRTAGQSSAKPDMMATHPSTPERVAQAIQQARQIGAPGLGEGGRDAYLSAIDGLAFGDDPQLGVVSGVSFIHPKLGFSFSAPDGFTLDNQSSALICVGEGGTEAIRLDNVTDRDGTLESAIASGWIDGLKTDTIQGLKVNELTAATASAKGEQWSFRLGAIRLGSRIFRLIYAARSFTPDAEARFRASLNSFRRLGPNEASRAQFMHVRILEAQSGDTPESLAQRMAQSDRAQEQFLLLNGLERGAALKAGQRYKIVAP